MGNANTVNELLLYSGTLLVAVAMFAVMLVSFLGMLLLVLAARAVQMVLLPLADTLRRPWQLWRAAGSNLAGSAFAAEPSLATGAVSHVTGAISTV